ncbi:MAG: regulatory protein NosR [Xanthobacteraceae bacterium]|nr:MAG: regulatory protein NosR [Xanthobacteraceae bacterium]
MLAGATQSRAAQLAEFLPKATAGDFFPGADRFGPPQGDPPIVPVYRGDELRGFVYLNSDFTNAIGYSGKPIHLLIGIDPAGVIAAIKLIDHKEPIVLIGIPEKRIVDALNSLVGKEMAPVASGTRQPPQVDIISGATVTMLVMGDSVVRSAVRLIRSGRIAASGVSAPSPAVVPATKTIDLAEGEARDWNSLLADGSVRRLHLTIGDINAAFARSGNAAAIANPEPGAADDTFIDLYLALATVPTIGRSLLRDAGYAYLKQRLKPGQQAIIVAGEGLYSFKGSGYVRGGIFDRIELLQDGSSTRFRDRNHTRLGRLEAAGAPPMREISLFVVPEEFSFDPAEQWQLMLLVQRAVGAHDKAFLSFDLGYTVPEKYLKREQPAVTVTANRPSAAPSSAPTRSLEEPLWQRMWKDNIPAIAIVAVAIGVLTVIFFFQNVLVSRPRLNVWVRRLYLLFILVWLGWYANAQLSVVNVLTFTTALVTGFNWEYFLTAPLIFLLWAGVAASLLFWGRGPFCGWLCPFGALQELLNNIAQALKVPQLRIPWALHERLWPIKYMIFLGLFAMSLYSIGFAEQLSEVEPFKTAIVLKFARGWPFVVYAVALLAAGLFVERFFCRYLCPLGAALAIPGRIRMFEWLKRWPECGRPCQRCAHECPVQSIHPEGHINVNECIYCMHCQELYWDDQRCPHMIQVRLKRERREALSSPSMRGGGKGPAEPVITHNGKVIPQ